MSKKKEVSDKKPSKIELRIREINIELSRIDQKRIDFADYMNKFETLGRKQYRAFEEMQKSTFAQEQKLKSELVKLEAEQEKQGDK